MTSKLQLRPSCVFLLIVLPVVLLDTETPCLDILYAVLKLKDNGVMLLLDNGVKLSIVGKHRGGYAVRKSFPPKRKCVLSHALTISKKLFIILFGVPQLKFNPVVDHYRFKSIFEPLPDAKRRDIFIYVCMQFINERLEDHNGNCALLKEKCNKSPSHWRPYSMKSGDALFYHNTVTGEHKWEMNSDSPNSSNIPSEPVFFKYGIEDESTSSDVDRNCNTTLTGDNAVKRETEAKKEHNSAIADQSEDSLETQFMWELDSIEMNSNLMSLRSTVQKQNYSSYVNSRESSLEERDSDYEEYFSDTSCSTGDNCSNFSDELEKMSLSESEEEEVVEENARGKIRSVKLNEVVDPTGNLWVPNNSTLSDQQNCSQISSSVKGSNISSFPPGRIGTNIHQCMPSIQNVFSLHENTTKLVIAKVNYEERQPGSSLDSEVGELQYQASRELQETINQIRTMWHSISGEERQRTKENSRFSYFLPPIAIPDEEDLVSVSHISSVENNEVCSDMSASKITTRLRINQVQKDENSEQEDNETSVRVSSQYKDKSVLNSSLRSTLETLGKHQNQVHEAETTVGRDQVTTGNKPNERLTSFPATAMTELINKQRGTSNKSLTSPNTVSFVNDGALRRGPATLENDLNSHLSSSKCLGGSAWSLNGLPTNVENLHSKYKCYYCAKDFCLQKELQRHLALRHLLFGGVFLCNSCDDSFLSHEELSQHLLLHDNVKPVKCRHCEAHFVTVEGLASHMSSHLDDLKHPKHTKKNKPLESKGEDESERQDVGEESKLHKRRCCADCNKEFNHYFALRLHLRTHGKENHHLCLLCGKWHLDLKSLRKHVIIHLREKHLECDICHKTFRFCRDYQQHQVLHVPGQLFRCEKRRCKGIFNSWAELRQHEIVDHEERRYRCRECGKSFSRQKKLICHSRLHTGEKPLACNKCGRRFRTRVILKNHEKIHLESKTYECNVCDKRFKQKCSMLRHVKTHRAGPKEYHCNLCKKRFTQSCSLQRHLRIHSGEKFKCPKCPMKFLESWRMRMHIKSKHSEQ